MNQEVIQRLEKLTDPKFFIKKNKVKIRSTYKLIGKLKKNMNLQIEKLTLLEAVIKGKYQREFGQNI